MRNAEKDEIEMTARRDAMLKEGFRLFSEKGIEAVSMNEVANACGVGIATLYRYYKTKLELVLAIGVAKWRDFAGHVQNRRAERSVDGMTAAEELDLYLDCYIDLYRDNKDLLRFNQNFNNYVQHEGATAEQMTPYLQAIGEFAGYFHRLYEKGKRDKTVRTDLPEKKLFAATAHIMIAVAVRYAQGLIYAGESEEDRTEEYLLLKRMILREFTL
ncbi:MAG: TetR/AcrR family transcriptional regulator [Clostridia bacterium]|nr:TetR/AcrR family transcriptional regulator [Clostridia bacterium]